MRKKIFVLGFILLFLISAGYTQLGLNNAGPFGKHPDNYTPAAPEAASFQRYGDLSASNQHGLVDISIPLGSINLKNFSWPISLGYYSGGNKVGDVANSAGLGWTLNAYGIQSSKVIGRPGSSDPDRRLLNLYSSTYDGAMDECVYYSETDVELAENIVGGGTDYLPDLTYINTPLFNLKAVGGMIFPATDMQGISGGYRDTKGNRYIFGSGSTYYNSTMSNTCFSPAGTTYNYSAMLTQVITYEGDEINFSYDSVAYGYYLPSSQYRTSVMSSQCQRCNYEIGGESQTCNNIYAAQEAYLTKIESSNGDVVRFYYSTRSDFPDGRKLDSIQFKRKVNGTEELLKTFILVHSYFGSGSADDMRLKLTEVKLLDKYGIYVNSYLFEYNSTNLPNRVTSKAHDWLGFYNGASNSSLLPDEGDRTSNTTYAKASILEKITYPTGGYTIMDHERNPFGGLRIKSLKDYDGFNATPKVRSFNYHVAEGAGGNPGLAFEDYLVSNYFATETNGTLDPQNDSWVYLLNCYTQRMNSSPVTNTVMNFIQNEDYYTWVTEYFGEDSTNGKVDYFYDNTVQVTGNVFFSPVVQLVGKKIYKRNGSGFDLLTESSNLHEQIYQDTSDVFADPQIPLENRIWVKDVTKLRDEMVYERAFWPSTHFHWCKQFLDNSFSISSMPVLLTKTIDKTYLPGTGTVLIDTTKFYYDDAYNMQPTRIQKTNSKGDVLVVKNTYPGATIPVGVTLTQGEQDALTLLHDVNIRTSPFHTETTKNNTVTGKGLQTFQTVNSLALPKKEFLYPTGASDYVEAQYNAYDSKSNLKDFQGKDKVNQSMIYDSSSNIVAHCTGALNIDIAYTSFESGSSGNWSGVSYSNIVNSAGVTGNKYHNQTSFSISKSSLTTSTYYTVSYWSKNGSYSISGTQSGYPKTLNSVTISSNTWTLYEHLITGQSTITVTGTGAIDELRLHPKIAQMTTSTYEPLIGINTQSDAANHILYYEYDSAARLKLIRDQDQNILKTYNYKYVTQ